MTASNANGNLNRKKAKYKILDNLQKPNYRGFLILLQNVDFYECALFLQCVENIVNTL